MDNSRSSSHDESRSSFIKIVMLGHCPAANLSSGIIIMMASTKPFWNTHKSLQEVVVILFGDVFDDSFTWK